MLQKIGVHNTKGIFRLVWATKEVPFVFVYNMFRQTYCTSKECVISSCRPGLGRP
jgi:hypothetical protein